MSDHEARFLIVDDLADNRFLLEKILIKFGKVEEAIDGAEAVEAFRRSKLTGQPFDIIFLDILMPGVDGHEALRQIREIEKEQDIPSNEQVLVVIVSALGDWDNVLQSYKKGEVADYLVKPITMSKVRLVVNKLLNRSVT